MAKTSADFSLQTAATQVDFYRRLGAVSRFLQPRPVDSRSCRCWRRLTFVMNLKHFYVATCALTRDWFSTPAVRPELQSPVFGRRRSCEIRWRCVRCDLPGGPASRSSLPGPRFQVAWSNPDPSSKGPFYRYNSAERQVYFSAFHFGPETAARYVQALRDHEVTWLTGYTFSYYLLARLILEQGLKVPELKAVITTSEKLTPEMRQVMEAAYRCRVYEEYSTVENSVFASECEAGKTARKSRPGCG